MRLVLVHGALAGAWIWDDVVPELAAMGHDAVAVELPGHGRRRDESPTTMTEYRDAVLEQIRTGDVLVGHSAGGWAITLAADAAPERVRHLVYFAAALPDEGQPANARRISAPEMQRYTRLTPDGKGSELASFEGAREHFFHDCDEADARRAFEQLCPEPVAPLGEPMSVPTFWATPIPRSYILCTKDRAYPVDYMQGVARTLGVEPILVSWGHFPMVSRPRETAELIVAAARG
jgi:pimeloyl-ACP methyl ester carboxylesterase